MDTIDSTKYGEAQDSELSSNTEQATQDIPMNWPWLRKHLILLQCGFHAAGPGFTSAVPIPGIHEMAEQFNVSPQTATYLVGVHVLFLGVAPFFWNPLMRSYGRRLVLIASMLLSCIAALGGGFAKTYGTLMVARVFQSIELWVRCVSPFGTDAPPKTTPGSAEHTIPHRANSSATVSTPGLIAFAYGVTFAITSPGISVILPLALEEFYGFGATAQGLFFLGPLVGVLLGERLGGPGSDWAMNRERRRATTRPSVVIFGVTLQSRTHWIVPCIGFGISNFGLQLVTTPLKTYCVDCYSSHSPSVLQLINIIRQAVSFTVPFWSPNLNEAVGYGLGFGIEAIILACFYLCSLLVLWKGTVWRQAVRVKGLTEEGQS
ncbi:hypothetical protein FQN49_001666 [Arthroderma sp. PD_2]|nr:hypothetical protein FQN49_001666 [Arthroderma sp. PD_2]